MEIFGSQIYAVLPLRDIVVFPDMIAPLFVGREKSILALDEVIKDNKKILLVTQKEASEDDPKEADLHHVGVIANILQLLKLPDGTVKVLVEGQKRAEITSFVQGTAFFQAHVRELNDDMGNLHEAEALARAVVSQFDQYVKLSKKISPEVVASLSQIDNPSRLGDTVASHLAVKIPDKQGLLEITNVSDRLERLYGLIEGEIGVLNAEKKIRSRVKRQMEKTQKEYYLNEQMKAIQRELGEGEDGKDEVAEMEERIKKARMPKDAMEKSIAELKKLRHMSPMSAEATVIRNYLDWMINLPWKKTSPLKYDIKQAEKILDRDHYGLEKVKERILEHLAVQQRMKKLKGPILCLVGPPGVGKTSLARSIAEATGRKYVRMSLGGVRDEAEIRGHRRTYIGSMPGKIVQSLRKVKSSNPLFLLDEIDKMGVDYRGDPASAMLEVLDPEQNSHFADHYLEVDYDLSDIMFVATANSLNLPRPLLDRMEIIRLSGYTEEEKIQIAKQHLIDKQRKEHGLKADEWSLSDDALRELIRSYTREAGVRSLEREIAKLARKAIKEILMKPSIQKVAVTPRNLQKYAGVPRFTFDVAGQEDRVGVTTGLAYTEVGGDLLYIEAVKIPGKGKVTITGKLGDVMQESAQAAVSYIRSRSQDFGVIPPDLYKHDIHIHVPEGATPKDGPSAGAAMCTTIVSLLTQIPVKHSVAMTGEITLQGRVLAIGGLKEKLLAALRGGIKTVLIPKENLKDLAEIPQNVKRGLEIIPVSTVDEVLNVALVSAPKSVEWKEETPTPNSNIPPADGQGGEVVIKH